MNYISQVDKKDYCVKGGFKSDVYKHNYCYMNIHIAQYAHPIDNLSHPFEISQITFRRCWLSLKFHPGKLFCPDPNLNDVISYTIR